MLSMKEIHNVRMYKGINNLKMNDLAKQTQLSLPTLRRVVRDQQQSVGPETEHKLRNWLAQQNNI